jgi:hypothetical protein
MASLKAVISAVNRAIRDDAELAEAVSGTATGA